MTRTRARDGGYWITGVDGLLTKREMLRLQGLPECLTKIAETAGVSDKQLRQMIGSAMSAIVLVGSAGCSHPWGSPEHDCSVARGSAGLPRGSERPPPFPRSRAPSLG